MKIIIKNIYNDAYSLRQANFPGVVSTSPFPFELSLFSYSS